MVQLSSSYKRRPDFVTPATPAVKLEIEEPLDDEHGPQPKRSKAAVPPPQQAMYQNVFDEPSPLGLRLRKSPSLVDLIQMRLAQVNSASTSCVTSLGDLDARKNKETKSTTASSTVDKMKASNFPVSLLRIGTWECVSRYEGDLVAKCYFAKHKLVWEVLEGGLKSKIEIQWSDITALKATCPENGLGALDLVLARPPLFFRETDPQPRKHTLWQATQDFTNGQASIYRRHFLQCSQALLSKNFEKLIQCDPRLNSLSQQPEINLDSPYFESRCSAFEDHDDLKHHGFDNGKGDYATTFSGFHEYGSCGAKSIANKNELPDSVGRAPHFASQDTPSPCSGSETQAVEESATREAEVIKPNWWDQLKLPGLRGSMSVSDLVSHLEHHISEQLSSGNVPLSRDVIPDKSVLEDIAQYLLSDSQCPATSDEQSLISRVNSFCCLLQKDAGAGNKQNSNENNSDKMQQDAGSEYEPDSPQDDKLDDVKPTISRNESYGELLILPRIASMPQFLFNISENSQNEAR